VNQCQDQELLNVVPLLISVRSIPVLIACDCEQNALLLISKGINNKTLLDYVLNQVNQTIWSKAFGVTPQIA
jgi:hypothetical protein